MARTAAEEIRKMAEEMSDRLIVCGTGELAQQTAESLWKTSGQESSRVRLAASDDFEGSGRFPVSVYNQDLGVAAREIYECLERQREEKSGWRARIIPVKGTYIPGR